MKSADWQRFVSAPLPRSVHSLFPHRLLMALREIALIHRQLGTRAALLWLFDRIAKRIMVFDVTHVMALELPRIRVPRQADASVTYQFLTPDQIRYFASDPSNEIDNRFAGRAAQERDLCYAAVCGQRLAAYAWFALGSIESQHNRGADQRSGVAVSYPENVAFMYKGRTHPDFRGGGLYGTLMGRALQELSRRGIDKIVSTSDWTNWSALRSCYRLGYYKLGLVLRCGWGNRLVTVSPRSARRHGLRFGGDAVVTTR